MEDLNERMREIERKSRAAFDASVAAQDAATRSHLARARARALAALGRRRLAGPVVWLPAGAAAAALVAALLWPRDEVGPSPAAVAFDDLEMLAGGEDFDLVREDADFVAWAVAASADGIG